MANGSRPHSLLSLLPDLVHQAIAWHRAFPITAHNSSSISYATRPTAWFTHVRIHPHPVVLFSSFNNKQALASLKCSPIVRLRCKSNKLQYPLSATFPFPLVLHPVICSVEFIRDGNPIGSLMPSTPSIPSTTRHLDTPTPQHLDTSTPQHMEIFTPTPRITT